MYPDLVKLALNPHGTRAVQKILEFVKMTDECVKLLKEVLTGHVAELSTDLHGNHTIQICLKRMPRDSTDFIFEEAKKNCVRIANHKHGCCVLQKCLESGNGVQKGGLVVEVIANSKELVLNPYGNYVVQHILMTQNSEHNK